MSRLIIGIDPGFSGAIAFLDIEGGLLQVMDMPVWPNTKGRTEIDHGGLYRALELTPYDAATVWLEQVAARPGQGAASTFRFGQGYGAIEMAVAANGHAIRYVTPARWKRHFGLTADKGGSRALATQRFPAQAGMFKRAKDDGRAEAALIAAYGASQK